MAACVPRLSWYVHCLAVREHAVKSSRVCVCGDRMKRGAAGLSDGTDAPENRRKSNA